MRIYETGFILAPNLAEEETEQLILQMADIIAQRDGQLIRQDRWGKRRLAYPIKKFSDGFYVFFQYEGKADIPSELERRFKQTDSVLRYLTLKKEAKEEVRRKKKKEPRHREKDAPGAGEELSSRESDEEVK
ncbi:MAG: 30S ribosomal protein S6 [Clostridiales bacterium]|jgi:small subunit ribosomal protein S6|nr:30S ribosomal protein S6 [Clostridiales bacterium]